MDRTKSENKKKPDTAETKPNPGPRGENTVTIKDLTVEYKMKKYSIRAACGVSLDIKRGRMTALVGESGSGKTTVASALLNCISTPGEIVSGEIIFQGKDGGVVDVGRLNEKQLNAFRWSRISMVFQGAQSSLNPVMTILDHFYETMKVHEPKTTKGDAADRTRRVLSVVNLNADRIMKMYPHERSGGMKQRVMIAMSLLLDPELIILDEPTTALDVITQDYIFKILKRINKETGIAMLLLTHDISIVAKFTDYMAVMYAGRVVEYGKTADVFRHKAHPYTRGLIMATPSLYGDLESMKPIGGAPPDLMELPEGCVFRPRCPYADETCGREEPILRTVGENHLSRCQKEVFHVK